MVSGECAHYRIMLNIAFRSEGVDLFGAISQLGKNAIRILPLGVEPKVVPPGNLAQQIFIPYVVFPTEDLQAFGRTESTYGGGGSLWPSFVFWAQ